MVSSPTIFSYPLYIFTNITAVRNYPLTATAAFSGDIGPRAHTCVSRKLYSQFRQDGFSNLTENSDDDEMARVPSSDEDEVGPIGVGGRPTSVPRRSPRLATASNSPTQPQSLSLQRTHSFSSASGFLPSAIWKVPFAPHVGRYSGLYEFNDIAEDAYEAATSGLAVDELEIRGEDVKALAAAFSGLLAEAAKDGDFTDVLTPHRHFTM